MPQLRPFSGHGERPVPDMPTPSDSIAPHSGQVGPQDAPLIVLRFPVFRIPVAVHWSFALIGVLVLRVYDIPEVIGKRDRERKWV